MGAVQDVAKMEPEAMTWSKERVGQWADPNREFQVVCREFSEGQPKPKATNYKATGYK